MINFHILVVGAVLAFLARVRAIDADELLIQQFICLHMTKLRVGKSVNTYSYIQDSNQISSSSVYKFKLYESFGLRVVVVIVVEVEKFPRLADSILVMLQVPPVVPHVISVTADKQRLLHNI